MKTKFLTLLAAIGLTIAVAGQGRLGENVEDASVKEKYAETVRRGIEYLVKNQLADGHWEGDKGRQPTATTALAGMALLMQDDKDGKPSESLKMAVDWLLEKSRAGRDGLITSGHASETEDYMEGHGLATQMLAWTLKREKNADRAKKLYDAVSDAVRYTAKAQSSQGGWYRTSKLEGHDLA